MKKVLATLAAVLMSGAIAFASSVPTFTGASEPSQIFAYLNQLITSLQSGVNGVVAAQVGVTASAATTNEQTLATTTIPGNTLSKGGQALRLRCSGLFANTSHATNTVKLYYGTATITTTSTTTSGQSWHLELMVADSGGTTSTTSEFVGMTLINSAPGVMVATSNAADDLSTALTAKCTTTQGTASASDVVLHNFSVEQSK